jgi:hypothetical protein
METESPVQWSEGVKRRNGTEQRRGVVISSRKAMDINIGPETKHVIEHIEISLSNSIMIQ